MYVSSEVSGNLGVGPGPFLKALSSSRSFLSNYPDLDRLSFHRELPPALLSHHSDALKQDQSSLKLTPSSLRGGRLEPASQPCMDLIGEEIKQAKCGGGYYHRRRRITFGPMSEKEPARTKKRLELASDAIMLHPALVEDAVILSHEDDRCIHLKSQELIATRITNWPGADLLPSSGKPFGDFLIALASVFYGAIHAAAWNDSFPTDIEAWMWRASVCHIMFWGLLWATLELGAHRYRILENAMEYSKASKIPLWQKLVFGIPNGCCVLLFLVARCFVVVEAFISVRSLPPDAYSTPPWTQVFPHL